MSSPGAETAGWDSAGALFRCLSAPLRVGIITLLSAEDRSVRELVAALNVSQPLVSQHLKVLREGRLVEGERRGREMRYRLADEHVAHIVTDALAHATEHDIDPQHTPTRHPREEPS